MRRVLPVSIAFLLAGATPLLAQLEHVDSTQISCAQAAALLAERGQVIFDTSEGIFDLYVRDASFCPTGKDPESSWIPTSDRPQCPVGYRCVTPEPTIPVTSQ